MTQLALIAASGRYSRANLETSVIGGVPLERFKPLGSATYSMLRDHAPDGLVFCWGARQAGARSTGRSSLREMSPSSTRCVTSRCVRGSTGRFTPPHHVGSHARSGEGGIVIPPSLGSTCSS